MISNESTRTIPLNLLLALAALVIIVGGMRAGASLLVPLLLALFIAVVCTSPVHWLHRCGLSLRLSVWVTLLVLGILISLLGLLLASSFTTFTDALPTLEEELNAFYLNLLRWLAQHGVSISPEQFSEWVDPTQATQLVPTFLSELGNMLIQSVVVALLVIFMLFETLNFRDKVSQALRDPGPSLRGFQQFSLTLKRYLAVKTVVSLITGALVWIACMVLNVDFPLLWATMAFGLNFIPNIGSVLAAIPPVILLLVTPGGGVLQAAILAGAYLVINLVMGNLIEPRMMGRALGLSTFVAFLSLVVWGWIFGTVGMLLSVLLTMTLKIALESHPETRWIARLLGPAGEREERMQEEEGQSEQQS
ncbi:AI-2E family transporter [Aidingimonas halophila]|uniref:Predicted PurR-regulated permease PerM n=1 Tax=Aidingimonas halophila TaxID=574349 RepID=A0A1H3A7Z7_9GAMM|nr:AI-2E family transporter [Aidingimonas halophila]GHC21679.1 pheromone autoinducer 2 transporter [Aidingimonas halophila]SDX25294.1 Predicted PurR-regulated permease PerM [Aidingimonas halophila]